MDIYQITGLLFVIIMLPVPVGWIFIHKTIKFWRKLGKTFYLIIILAWIIVAFLIYLLKDYIINYKLDYFYLRYLGVVILLIAIYLDYQRAKVFSFKYLIGLIELKNKKEKLITSGIYSKIRHPRYLSYMLVCLGLAFFTQLISLFILFPIFVLLFYILTLVEEKELIARFGKEYKSYIEEVPGFIPKIFSD